MNPQLSVHMYSANPQLPESAPQKGIVDTFIIRVHVDGPIRICFNTMTNEERTKKEQSSVRSNEFAVKFEYSNIGFCAFFVDNIYRGVLDTRVNPDTSGRANSIRICYVWTRKFSNLQQKFSDSEISGYMWTGPEISFLSRSFNALYGSATVVGSLLVSTCTLSPKHGLRPALSYWTRRASLLLWAGYRDLQSLVMGERKLAGTYPLLPPASTSHHSGLPSRSRWHRTMTTCPCSRLSSEGLVDSNDHSAKYCNSTSPSFIADGSGPSLFSVDGSKPDSFCNTALLSCSPFDSIFGSSPVFYQQEHRELANNYQQKRLNIYTFLTDFYSLVFRYHVQKILFFPKVWCSCSPEDPSFPVRYTSKA